SEAEAFGVFFAARGLEAPRLYPMIRARMTAINGEPMAERAARSDRGRGFAEREQNLSWSAELAATPPPAACFRVGDPARLG
ncbi:MAG TPA: hypothetical protein PKA98_08895, partial [Acidimicrobiales bacterium]|nr:hypothetical protein [Acidimicrobiales bacterium]